MALLPGSPALNAGDPSQLGTPDQRGVVRSGGVTIGAYQASATAFLLSAPDTVQSGVPFDVTVTAVDPLGQLAVGYIGTVTFSTSDPDPGVVLPADYTFTLGDGGVHTFTDTGLGETALITPGDQMLTVMDTADNTINGSAIITVSSTPPAPWPHGQGTQGPAPLPPAAGPSATGLTAVAAPSAVVRGAWGAWPGAGLMATAHAELYRLSVPSQDQPVWGEFTGHELADSLRAGDAGNQARRYR
jgi:hypothetical protein